MNHEGTHNHEQDQGNSTASAWDTLAEDVPFNPKQEPTISDDELARICTATNGGELDPEELQYYKENPDKVPQLLDKYREMNGEPESSPESSPEPTAEQEPTPEPEPALEPEPTLESEPDSKPEPSPEPGPDYAPTTETAAAEGGTSENPEPTAETRQVQDAINLLRDQKSRLSNLYPSFVGSRTSEDAFKELFRLQERMQQLSTYRTEKLKQPQDQKAAEMASFIYQKDMRACLGGQLRAIAVLKERARSIIPWALQPLSQIEDTTKKLAGVIE